FLSFFFSRLERNRSGRHEGAFPWLSRCGRERNFLRCEDVPVVFTALLSAPDGAPLLSYSGCGLTVPFRPSRLALLPHNGRLYHPGPERAGGVGLVRSALAQEWSSEFEFGEGMERPPTHFWWGGERIRLSAEWVGLVRGVGGAEPGVGGPCEESGRG
ncbi:UPF0598 protein C8orf82 homolog, partial [Malurus melanocephalus]|uniref:UPF0598 protein C8orf82 homolog n=1 Tax=Malurus melanocephalus TaxID=175006 RepID=UPI0025476E32